MGIKGKSVDITMSPRWFGILVVAAGMLALAQAEDERDTHEQTVPERAVHVRAAPVRAVHERDWKSSWACALGHERAAPVRAVHERSWSFMADAGINLANYIQWSRLSISASWL